MNLTYDDARRLEGYAAALADMMFEKTGDSPCGKSYDPMLIEEGRGIMHSYAFDMKDGGRHHPITDYSSVDEIKETLLREAMKWISTQ